MANEATKKDLADLEKRINKALADETAALNKAIEQTNKAIEQLNKNDALHDSELKTIADAVNNNAKAVTELQKKCD